MTEPQGRTPIYPKPLRLVAALVAAGYHAYLVGGCVRDHILGRPIHDYDITTSATPEQVAALFPDSKHVGASFGVSLVDFEGERFEVATFRTEGAYSDRRRPDTVAYTTDVLEDLRRRDFTMNALLMTHSGLVVDMVEGMRDLNTSFIRCIGSADERLREDPLRTLRAIRFAAQLNFTIEADTFRAMKELWADLAGVSEERKAQEVTKILTSGNAVLGFMYLKESGLLSSVLPELVPMENTPQNPKHHPEGNVWEHTMGLLRQLKPGCSPTLAWGALLHDVGKPETMALKYGQPTFHGHEQAGARIAGELLEELRFSNEFRDRVVTLVDQHMRFRVAKEMRRSKLLRFIGRNNFAELLELHKMDARAGSGNLEHAEFVERVLAETPEHVLHPVHLVSGKDLIDMGVKPGPFFRKALEEVKTLQLEGVLDDRDIALEFLIALNTAHLRVQEAITAGSESVEAWNLTLNLAGGLIHDAIDEVEQETKSEEALAVQ